MSLSPERQKLEELINNSNLPELEEYVKRLEEFQRSILKFNHPSLVLLAIEVYLNPVCVTNIEYQLDIVVFLLKCGLSLFVPNGPLAVYIMDLGAKWGIPEKQIMKLFNVLVDYHVIAVFSERISEAIYPCYKSCSQYLERNWAAFKIQRLWKSKRNNKTNEHKQHDEILLILEKTRNFGFNMLEN